MIKLRWVYSFIAYVIQLTGRGVKSTASGLGSTTNRSGALISHWKYSLCSFWAFSTRQTSSTTLAILHKTDKRAGPLAKWPVDNSCTSLFFFLDCPMTLIMAIKAFNNRTDSSTHVFKGRWSVNRSTALKDETAMAASTCVKPQIT